MDEAKATELQEEELTKKEVNQAIAMLDYLDFNYQDIHCAIDSDVLEELP